MSAAAPTIERWLVTGASGQLGSHVLARLLAEPRPPAVLALVGRTPARWPGAETCSIDLADFDALGRRIDEFRPTHILHLGAMTVVSDAFNNRALADRVNTHATRLIGRRAASHAARLVYTSTDMVFDGEHAPYDESAKPAPPSYYGVTKLAGERELAAVPRALVVRVPLMYGYMADTGVPHRPTTFSRQIDALRSGEPLRLFTDEFRSPVWVADAAAALIALARHELAGVIHVTGPQRLSRLELVQEFARVLRAAEPGLPEPNIVPISRLSIESPEPRPRDLSLAGETFNRLLPRLAPGPVCAAALVP